MEIYIVTSEHYWEVYGVTKILSGGVELIFKLYIYIYIVRKFRNWVLFAFQPPLQSCTLNLNIKMCFCIPTCDFVHLPVIWGTYS